MSEPARHEQVETKVVERIVYVERAASKPEPSSGAAAVLSLVFPGAGQIYKGQTINGLIWFPLVVGGYIMMFFPGLFLHLCCVIGAARPLPAKKN